MTHWHPEWFLGTSVYSCLHCRSSDGRKRDLKLQSLQPGLWGKTTWVQALTLSLPSRAIWSKVFNDSEPQVPHLYNGGYDTPKGV